MQTTEYVIQEHFIRQWDDSEVFGTEAEALAMFRIHNHARRPHRLIKRTVEVLATSEMAKRLSNNQPNH